MRLRLGTMRRGVGLAAVAWLLPVAMAAQMAMSASTLVEAEQQHGSSGTSVEPAGTPVPMLMGERGGWRLMFHANAFVADTQQQARSERGRDAFFSTNWFMPMAQRAVGPGVLTLRAMFSLEPGTVGSRAYPELFQQGETAYGKPIVDGQHPHDFVMELAAMYDVPLGERGLLSFYAAPVGDPAIGPTAYPHRLSASEDPIAALGHHQEDSTHIAFNVLTAGVTYGWVRAEVSGFHGGEPAENRWNPEPASNGHAVDSVSGRLTVAPGKDWAGQYSWARIARPEALYPREDQQRQTASVMFHHAWAEPMEDMPGMAGMKMSGGDEMAGMPGMSMPGAKSEGVEKPKLPAMKMSEEPRMDFSATLVWGRTREIGATGPGSSKANSYLAEGLLRFARRNYAWTRMENAARTNELELAPGSALPVGFDERPVGHVAAFTFGYDRDFAIGPHLVAAPGAQVTVYRAPGALQGIYGATPVGEVVFVRLRVR